MSQHSTLISSWWGRLRGPNRLSEVWFDAALYGASALFAGVVALGSHIPLYREWGKLALAPYLLISLVAMGLALSRLAGRRLLWGRVILCGVAIVGAVVVPMSCEVAWRFSESPQDLHVQPEVTVIERAADHLVHGRDPYQAKVVNNTLQGQVVGLPPYEAFFPYLPAMTLFGIPMALSMPAHLGDARLWFLGATLLCVALALWRCRAEPNRRVRALQVAVVLPWAALALATGGDDLPIVGLLLVAVVLAAQRRPVASGLVLGLVSAMKFTAWPVALLLLFAAWDRQDKRATGRMLGAMALVAAPIVVVFAAWDPSTFVANVISFPLGLSGVASPAGSALPGHLFVTNFPALHHLYTVVVAGGGAVVLALSLWRHPPRTVAKVCEVAGWALLIAILLAPATRIGYLIYPMNLFVWSWMLRPSPDEIPAHRLAVP